jgi:transcriptional regulator with XRE-family HTH domain
MSRFQLINPDAIGRILAVNIRATAKKRRLPLNQLAESAGVSKSQLYNVLAGGSSASIGWISRIAVALEVEAWQLLKPRKAA